MQELVTQALSGVQSEIQGLAQAKESFFFPWRVHPLSNEPVERFLHFAFNGDDGELSTEIGDDHQIRLPVSSLCSEIDFTFKKGIDEFNARNLQGTEIQLS